MVETVDSVTADEFRNRYLRRGKAVVVRNPNFLKTNQYWNLEYLSRKHQDHLVEVEHYPDGVSFNGKTFVQMSLARYVQIARDPAQRARYYLAERALVEILPNVANELRLPEFLDQDIFSNIIAFAGIDTFSNLHYHPAPVEAVLMQVGGRKEVTLFAAKDYRLLYPHPWYSDLFNWSKIHLASTADLSTAFPRMRQAPAIKVVLEEGHCLFIPQGWFHSARGLGESISATAFFNGKWRHGYAPMALRDVLARTHQRFVSAHVQRLRRAFHARVGRRSPADLEP
jgi:Cupin-like domain